MNARTLSKLEEITRPIIVKLPKMTVISIYSNGRLSFSKKLENEVPLQSFDPPEKLSRKLWGINFRSPIMNAAGMFKNGECYEMTAKQGAGAYLGGTGTWNSREGNEKEGIYLPFIPYPISHSASNWLGLPNDGDEVNSDRASNMERINRCPVGWSIMGSPDLKGEEKLRRLVDGMRRYEHAGVDFLEINESCPNTRHCKPQDNNLANRLKYIKEYFLGLAVFDTNKVKYPVIVKFSNDTKKEQIPALLDLLFELGFSGVNFGNTSIEYTKRRNKISEVEKELYDFFTQTFGGGISGKPLKESSLELAGTAVEYLKSGGPSQEFHVIRTGGIETIKDLEESDSAGISLNQWFTGYREVFNKYGHDVYKKLFENG